MRMMAAKGLVPMKPNEMLSTLAILYRDADKTIRDAAEASLKKVPKKIVISALATKIHAHVIDFFARNFMDQDQLSAAIIANPTTKDETITYLAYKLENDVLLDRIAENQVRFLRYPTIIEALYFNPKVRMSTVSAIVDLAVREGIMIDHILAFKEVKEAIARSASGTTAKSPPVSTPTDTSAKAVPDKQSTEIKLPQEVNPEDMSLADFLAAMVEVRALPKNPE